MKYKTPIIISVVILIVMLMAAYTVDETEQVVITQFGKPVGDPIKEPGLYFTLPLFQALYTRVLFLHK